MQSTTSVHSIPRTIWMCWFQGWEQAPDIVHACLATWRRHNPDWAIRQLTIASIPDVLPDCELLDRVNSKQIPHAALSDVLRIALLRQYGGLWVDSTTYCLQPLDTWFEAKVQHGFFAFADPASPDTLVSSWFIGAAVGNYLVERWASLTHDYWAARNEPDHYFWFHRQFALGYRTDTQFRDIWDATPKLSRDGPHYFTPYDAKLWNAVQPDDVRFLDQPAVPLLKLTHKLRPGPYPEDSVLRYLSRRAVAERDGRTLSLEAAGV